MSRGSKRMRTLKVTIEPADGRGTYIARFQAELLQATFSVEVADSITGAVALHAFAEMLRHFYGNNIETAKVEFVFPQGTDTVRSPSFADVLAGEAAFAR